MKSLFILRSEFYIPTPTHFNLISSKPIPKSPSLSIRKPKPTSQIIEINNSNSNSNTPKRSRVLNRDRDRVKITIPKSNNNKSKSSSFSIEKLMRIPSYSYDEKSRFVIVGGVTVGVMMLLMGCDDHQKALAFGPEGPLMEEFWDNMRRYGLYALTVSSGVLYAVFQPLYELLKNPISAIFVLTILGGGFYIVSQVVSAMVGITEFIYDYNY